MSVLAEMAWKTNFVLTELRRMKQEGLIDPDTVEEMIDAQEDVYTELGGVEEGEEQ